MTQDYYSIITNSGLAKHAAASLGGAPINLTHLAVGDSNGTYYNPVATATALQNERYRTTLTYVQIDGSNPNQLIVEAVIDETVGPFYVREVGVFDSSGTLFAIGKFPETFKPNLPSGSGKKLYIRMILAFASGPQVNLVQSENLNYDPNFSTNVFASIALKLAKAANLSDVADAAQARNNLGLQIGVNVQAFATNLAAFAGLVGAAKKVPYFTGSGALATVDLFSNKNLIINGAFNIWQRGTSFSGVSGAQYFADRWSCILNGAMRFTVSRSTDVPTVAQAGRKFNYSLWADCTTASASIAATEYFCLRHVVEGYNYASVAEQIFTLSFWVKATKIGIYSVSAKPSSNNASCVLEYTINQANTWEFKTLTFPAPSASNGTWDYTNGWGIEFLWSLAQGATYQTNTLGQWQNTNYTASTNQVNACDNVVNDFRITGVQMEKGSIATPFEQRPSQEEVALCQRYFEKSYDLETAPGSITDLGTCFNRSIGGEISTYIQYEVRKRVNASLVVYSPVTGASGKIRDYSGNADKTPSYSGSGESNYGMGGSGMTTNNMHGWHYTANAEF